MDFINLFMYVWMEVIARFINWMYKDLRVCSCMTAQAGMERDGRKWWFCCMDHLYYLVTWQNCGFISWKVVRVQTVTYVVWRRQRVLVFEGQAGELRGVVGRSVTITGVAVQTHCTITWERKQEEERWKLSYLPGSVIELPFFKRLYKSPVFGQVSESLL